MKLWTVDCQNKLSEVSTDTCPSPSAILNPKNPVPGLVSWFHESGFGFGKSGLNKRTGFWNRFQFWSNQTGPQNCMSQRFPLFTWFNSLRPIEWRIYRRQAIIGTNTGILLIGPLGTYFREILIEIHTFSFTKMHLKMSSGKWRPFCLKGNVLSETRPWISNWNLDIMLDVDTHLYPSFIGHWSIGVDN